jgi:hypothetical protein
MTWDDMLAALDGRNGNGVSDNGIEELEEMFADSGYVFRHFPDAGCGALHWQAGRNVADVVVFEDGTGQVVEFFELLEWSSTREGLVDKLAAR